MASPLPPDLYAALGVPKDATSATIKSAYRKLALKCHPDKVTDLSLKAAKAAEFHQIQQAYEILGEDEKRERYNAQVRLAELKREALERQGRGGPKVDVRTASYEVRTPSGATYGSGSPREYDAPRSRGYEADDRLYEEPRRSAKYAYSSKRSVTPTRSTRDRERAKAAENDRARSVREKTRDKATRRERVGKFAAAYGDEDDSDERQRARRRQQEAMYEQEYMQREKERRDAEDARRRSEAARRDDDVRREDARREALRRDDPARRSSRRRDGYEDDSDEGYSRWVRREEDAVDYIRRGGGSPRVSKDDGRPSAGRSSSMREPPVYEHRKGSSGRAQTVRRSSAATTSKERIVDGVRYTSGSSRRDRGGERQGSLADIVEDRKLRPSLDKADSSPAAMRSAAASARVPSGRAATMDYQRSEYPAHPTMKRAETMPIPSKLRNETTATARDSGYSSSTTASPERDTHYKPQGPPPASNRKVYTYAAAPGGGISLSTAPSDYATVEMKPRKGSVSPVRTRDAERGHERDSNSKPERPTVAKLHTVPAPNGGQRVVYTESPVEAAPAAPSTRPSLSRGASYTGSTAYSTSRAPEPERERERGRAYERAEPTSRSTANGTSYIYGVIPKREEPQRPGMRRGGSYRREDISYAQPIRPENVSYSSRGRSSKTDGHHHSPSSYARPTMRHSATAY